ncbi:putative toxin-antitoxin system toxin component, PIN family [Butyrivibrio sp. INlla21]|uniref:putative toxin-antitoxin system toxin component, PIN family n=1 Tax=Butyrivibrio sp. INlla21 TaxID=1520811 RepID=UPI0008F05C6F|nr:putative toxin-antitoxin system toxin component, PIN family [Butyrivibrio sp. INlla21]SFV03826.1 putative toxin-antitoxin system toxin component, PIN family [Butyrivibrio sp. INlla21]
MRIVLDTNVIASAIFFGGKPKEVVDLLMNDKIDCFATVEIFEEYMETVEYLREKHSKNAPRIHRMRLGR